MTLVHQNRTSPPVSAFGQRRHGSRVDRCPLYPQKRTLELSRSMSAMCQKRTFVSISCRGHGLSDQPLSLSVQLTVECGLHRGGSGGHCLGRGSRMVENRRAPCGDGETKLIERKGERHPYRLVELLAFALMH